MEILVKFSIPTSSLSGFNNSKIDVDLNDFELPITTDESPIQPIEFKSQMEWKVNARNPNILLLDLATPSKSSSSKSSSKQPLNSSMESAALSQQNVNKQNSSLQSCLFPTPQPASVEDQQKSTSHQSYLQPPRFRLSHSIDAILHSEPFNPLAQLRTPAVIESSFAEANVKTTSSEQQIQELLRVGVDTQIKNSSSGRFCLLPPLQSAAGLLQQNNVYEKQVLSTPFSQPVQPAAVAVAVAAAAAGTQQPKASPEEHLKKRILRRYSTDSDLDNSTSSTRTMDSTSADPNATTETSNSMASMNLAAAAATVDRSTSIRKLVGVIYPTPAAAAAAVKQNSPVIQVSQNWPQNWSRSPAATNSPASKPSSFVAPDDSSHHYMIVNNCSVKPTTTTTTTAVYDVTTPNTKDSCSSGLLVLKFKRVGPSSAAAAAARVAAVTEQPMDRRFYSNLSKRSSNKTTSLNKRKLTDSDLLESPALQQHNSAPDYSADFSSTCSSRSTTEHPYVTTDHQSSASSQAKRTTTNNNRESRKNPVEAAAAAVAVAAIPQPGGPVRPLKISRSASRSNFIGSADTLKKYKKLRGVVRKVLQTESNPSCIVPGCTIKKKRDADILKHIIYVHGIEIGLVMTKGEILDTVLMKTGKMLKTKCRKYNFKSNSKEQPVLCRLGCCFDAFPLLDDLIVHIIKKHQKYVSNCRPTAGCNFCRDCWRVFEDEADLVQHKKVFFHLSKAVD